MPFIDFAQFGAPADAAAAPSAAPSSPLPLSFAAAIKRSEGFSPVASWDYKQHTNGYGTRARYPGERIDRSEAEQRFDAEIGKAARFVDSVHPSLDPGTRAALTSLTFNAGAGWANSGLGARIRAGDIAAARQHFLQYTRAGGRTLPGLLARRRSEAAWFGQPGSEPRSIDFAQYGQPAEDEQPQQQPQQPQQQATPARPGAEVDLSQFGIPV